MFNHFSLLFQPQAGEEEQKDVGGESLLNHHVRLCENVLEIYANVGSEVPLKEDTWEHLLKVVLGITDSLLGQPKGSDHLAERLCPSLLKVLFSLWLRSGMIGVMWDNLRDLIWHWRHRMPAIKYAPHRTHTSHTAQVHILSPSSALMQTVLSGSGTRWCWV